MIDAWAAETVGRMHLAGITGLQLAEECGFTNSYVSAVLHCKKGDEHTRQKINDGLARLEAKRQAENQTSAP